jgi:hypothetical protein
VPFLLSGSIPQVLLSWVLVFRLVDLGKYWHCIWHQEPLQDEIQPIRVSALSSQVCPETIFRKSVGTPWESACHVPDAHASHRCRTDDDCGIEAITCKKRTCSMAGYCGLWLVIY